MRCFSYQCWRTQIFVRQAILSYDSISIMYKPPFTITNNILKFCQSIAKELGFLEGTKILTPSVQLCKDNQIKTIYSSLAIEGNSLSEKLITQILEGKRILAPENDIIEVQVENGVWRSGGVGIISKDGVYNVAPQAKMVPNLMNQLFNFRTGG